MKQQIIAIAAAWLISFPVAAQDAQLGQEVFEDYCATCHGSDARGEGPMADILLVQPTNLRRLSATNDGVFPTVRVVKRIDGRDPLLAHGSMMPVYGHIFQEQDTPMKAETGQPIMTSRLIVQLVAYLRGIQE